MKKRLFILLFSSILSAVMLVGVPIGVQQESLLQITVLGEHNINSKGNEVWVKGVYIDGQKIDNSKFSYTRTWNYKNENLESDVANSKLIWKGKAQKEITINLINHPWSGKAKIEVNGKSVIKDLYSPKSESINVNMDVSEIPLVKKLLLSLINLISIASLIFLAILFFLKLKMETTLRSIKRKKILIYSLPIFMVGCVFLVAFYPGTMSPDSIDQWTQAMTWKFNDNHPVIHTLLIWLLTRVWNSPAAIAFFDIIIMSLVIGHSLYQLDKIGVNKFYIFILMVWYSFDPVNGIMSIVLWKDIPFSCLIFLLTSILLELYINESNWLHSIKNQIFMASCLLFITLFRHNGIASVVGTLMVLTIFYWKEVRNLLRIALILIFVISLVKMPLYKELNVTPAPTYLSLVTPIHEVGTMIHENVNLNYGEKVFLSKILPIKDWDGGSKYSRYTSDYLVFNKNFNADFLNNNKIKFLHTWANLVFRNPRVALKDWLSMTSLIWRINQPEGGYTTTVTTDIYPNKMGLRKSSLSPILEKIFTSIISYTEDKANNWLFWRPALYLYIILLSAYVLFMKNKNFRILLIYVPLLFQILGFFLVIPSQDSRYLYSAILLAPYFWLLSLYKINHVKNDDTAS